MSDIAAQVSLYPLGQADLAPAIEEIWRALAAHGLHYQVGALSTVTSGEDAAVFAALREGLAQAIAHGPAVMVVTFTNACPAPSLQGARDG